MASFNRVVLMGHLGRDPEVRDVGDSMVCTFSIATTEKWKDKGGEKQERTDWHRIVAWGRLGEIAGEYLKKGSPVLVEGTLTQRKYEKDGKDQYVTEVKMTSMQLLGGKPEGGDRQEERPRQQERPAQRQSTGRQQSRLDDLEDDIPF